MIDLLILVADALFVEGHITLDERCRLVTAGGRVVDGTRFPVEICDNGDVYIHGRGPQPLIFKGYANQFK